MLLLCKITFAFFFLLNRRYHQCCQWAWRYPWKLSPSQRQESRQRGRRRRWASRRRRWTCLKASSLVGSWGRMKGRKIVSCRRPRAAHNDVMNVNDVTHKIRWMFDHSSVFFFIQRKGKECLKGGENHQRKGENSKGGKIVLRYSRTVHSSFWHTLSLSLAFNHYFFLFSLVYLISRWILWRRCRRRRWRIARMKSAEGLLWTRF